MLCSLFLVGFCVWLLYLFIRIQKPKNLPPGPRPLPIFGNLFHLNIKNPLKDFERLAEQYGNVYTLYIGRRPAIVLHGLKAIKEALVNKSADFSGRPADTLIAHVTEMKGVITADYGQQWKEHRHFALMTLRNFGLGKQTMEDRILGETEHIISVLEKYAGGSMSPQTLFHDAASNIISLVLFGTRYDYGDETLKEYVRQFTTHTKIITGPWAMIYDTLPVLRPLPLPFKEAFKNSKSMKEMTRNMINKHKPIRVPGEPRNLIDCYLDELDKKVEGTTFNEDQLVVHILNLHIAGTDTTSNTLLTAFLYLMTHPDIQERCQQEIDDVLEGKAQVSFEDRHNMPYIQAVIHESQRIANTAPLSLFHSTSRDTEVMGYSIPKGAIIIPNLSSVLSEEGQWKFPHEFNPENFLNEQGQFEKPEAFIPFSVGPRVCLGEGLARMELFLIMVTLLRRFRFVWPEDAGEPDFTPVFGLTLSPKSYRMGVRLRQPGFCIWLFYLFIRIQKPKNLPPGPRPLPIFGNLFHLNIKNPLKDFERLAQEYGNVYTLYIGRRPAIVLHGLKAIKEALVNKSADFSGRPADTLIAHVTEMKGIIIADYGQQWKEHRRFALLTLRNFGLGKQSMEDRILGEIEHIISVLEKYAGSSLSPQTLFHDAASNIISLVLFGTRYDYGDETLKEYVRRFTTHTKIITGPWAMIYDTLPVLRPLPLPFKETFENHKLMKEMTRNMINKHKPIRVPGEPRNLVDCYLDELDKKVEGTTFNEDQLVSFILNLHVAGTDTTSNTLLTAFLYLMTHPDIQERCRQEIDDVLEGKAQASFEDRHNMPYIQAVIHESQRIANTAPLSVFHSTSRDTEVMGYSIPKGAIIIPNLSSVLSEEGQWKFPHEFNPENFLNEQGQFEKPEAFIPFSVGPRVCLGEALARMELFLIMVTLLRRFRFVWPEDAGEPDFTPVFGLTLSPKPYRMGVRLRQPGREM